MDGAPFTTPPIDQARLRSAILDPATAVPSGLTDGRGRAAALRFAVYRNNVAVSLVEALRSAFPVVARLVGDDFFRAMAGVFVRAHPPRSARMMLYGDELPAFLATFPPVAHLPYLPDVARLEQSVREAYHAADAAPLDPARLSPSPDALARGRPVFAPAVRLVRSRHPINAIWRANTSGGPRPVPAAEDVLVTRPALDPVVTHLPIGGAVVARLLAGAPLVIAAEAEAADDLGVLFSTLLSTGALIGIEGDPT